MFVRGTAYACSSVYENLIGVLILTCYGVLYLIKFLSLHASACLFLYVHPLQSLLASASCTTTASGAAYVGTMATTNAGVHCQRWDDQVYHISNYTDDADFPDDTVADAADFCRNPRGDKSAPWCYTLRPDLEWDFCDVEQCGGE